LIRDLKAIRRGRTPQEDAEVGHPRRYFAACANISKLKVRPLIFIAHSLGGLLVKDVSLILAGVHKGIINKLLC
jgi:hypothetical protein